MAHASPAFAQSSVPLPPPHSQIDENGVDVSRGTFNYNSNVLSIGPAGTGGLSYGPQTLDGRWAADNFFGLASGGGGGVRSASFGGATEYFTLSGSTWVSAQGSGSTLTFDGIYYVYTKAGGTVITYDVRTAVNNGAVWTDASPTSVKYPDGTILRLYYKVITAPINTPNGNWTAIVVARLQSVTSNHGYMIKYGYSHPSATYLSSVTAINTAVDYCDPIADTCTGLTQSWPSVSTVTPYFLNNSYPAITSLTDPLNHTTNFALSGNYVTAIKRPGAATPDVSIGYDANNHVSSVTREGVTYTYSYVVSGGVATMTRTDPAGKTRIVTTTLSVGRPSSVQDELGHITSYTYDSLGRLTIVTLPDTSKIKTTFDARGNVTETRAISKTPGTPPDIVTSASYDATCTNILKCNKPNATFDANNNETDYSYDAATGMPTSVLAPAPATSAVRPETRYGYTSLQAYFKNSAGSIVASGQSILLPSTVSSCQTLASCAGTSDEVKTTIAYGPQTAGTANNLVPVSSTTEAGNNSLTASTAVTYDMIGNVLTVDGPLAGTADTARMRYNAARQVVGAVGPDPDGGGTLKNRAARVTYNLDGQVTLSETGTVNSQSDADWAGFVSLQQAVSSYDANARKTRDTVTAGGTTYAQVDYNYDALGRSDCTAVRMNPATFASAPGPCSLGTSGSFGDDRITRMGYDFASRVTSATTALGTPAASTNSTSYTINGAVETVTDGGLNKTTNEYDGLGRLVKTRYPSTTTGSGTSSTTDYVQLTYDPNGNVLSKRLRDGTSIAMTYDHLNRVTYKNLPGSEPDVSYAYDNFGRTTSAVDVNSKFVGYAYDALGRKTAESSALGVTGMGYDLAGRRTLTVWPDSYYVTYDYLVTGEMTAVRENGATSGAGVLTAYSYDDLGRRTLATLGNGTSTSYGFDNASQLTSLSHNLFGTANDVTLGFPTHNPAGQIGSSTRSNDTYAWLGSSNGNGVYTVNGLNQVTDLSGSALTFDGRGNLATTGLNTYSYSSENLLLTGPAGATLAYDPMMRLYAATGTPTEYYTYDGSQRIGEYNSSGTLLRRYVYGSGGDEPVVWYEGAGTSDRRWLYADERGSVIAVSDVNGVSIGTNTYDEYGVPATGNIGKFQYTGQAYLPSLSVYYYKARIYSSRLGRFMQTDPIGYGGGMNMYNYVGGDPVNSTDPSGTKDCPTPTCTGYTPGGSNFTPSMGGGIPGVDSYFDAFVSNSLTYAESYSNTNGGFRTLGGAGDWVCTSCTGPSTTSFEMIDGALQPVTVVTNVLTFFPSISLAAGLSVTQTGMGTSQGVGVRFQQSDRGSAIGAQPLSFPADLPGKPITQCGKEGLQGVKEGGLEGAVTGAGTGLLTGALLGGPGGAIGGAVLGLGIGATVGMAWGGIKATLQCTGNWSK